MPRCLKMFHRRQNGKRSSLVLALIAFILTLSAILTLKNAFRTGKECYILPDIGFRETFLLPDIMEDNKTPSFSRSIFFHETSCSEDQTIKLNSRQACAIESAAKMNPKWDVFVLFASPVGYFNKTSLPLIDALASYDNIHFRNVNLWDYAIGTPIYNWIRDGQIFYSSYMNSHVSDSLRYLRQACAIESAAKMNPKWDVFVLFASPVGYFNKTSLPLIDALASYDNIHFRNVNLWDYAIGTPIYNWIRDGQIFYSSYMNSHVSDFLRYLSLYKWGGTYLDLDVIVKVNFDTVPSNYAGAESENYVAAGIINLDHDGFGHEVAEMCLSDFQLNFNGEDWGNNGPGVITRVLRRICQTDRPLFMTRERCRGFKVFPISAFYAVGWKDWRHFFSEAKTKEVLEMVNNKSIVVHFWNKHSSKERVRVGDNSAYGQLADEYCPRVYRASGEFF
uniref:Alpha 1,4-glycosyltransferase domain-containing protein n=2 Tax=Lutzomyia longipalpis TaxID=7200 RepID=A0A1B0EZZ0_LUTLO